jgi:beta-lactamase class A
MKFVSALGICLWLSNAAVAQPAGPSAPLQDILDNAVRATLDRFATNKLQSNQLAVTLIDLRRETKAHARFRGDAPVYPASVVKLFYLAAAHRWMEDGRLNDSDELRRAMRDMIVDSSNDATHYVLDALTGTTGGPELSAAEMKVWGEKRNAVNRYFASLGYTNINVNQKPWNEGPYGRERVWVGQGYTNRNRLTTDATARLLSEIARKEFVSGKACEAMLSLLARTPGDAKDSQARFTFGELPAGSTLYSKAGWTSTTRHDAAYLELPDGRRFVLVTFTVGHASNRQIIPFLARQVLDLL